MSTPIRRLRAVAAATLAAVTVILSMAACGHSDSFSNFDQEGTVDYSDRPSMETVLDQYRAFQDDLIARLDERFSKRTWSQPPNDIGFDWGDCADPDYPDGASASLPSVGFDGVYPHEQWRRVRDLVMKVGKEHGFTEIVVNLDQPDAVEFEGHDPTYGAVYDFGMGKNTGFGITTGCHAWETPPPPVS